MTSPKCDRVSLGDIVRRQKILSHGYDVLNRMNPETGRRLMPQEGAFVRAFYDYARAIRMADRSFGANGSSLVHQ